MVVLVQGEKEGNRARCAGITEVPNCVMESILSLLPLKDAVNTIMASPLQWKTLSHSILTRRSLELDYLNVSGSNFPPRHDVGRESQAFVRRVSKYLQQYQGHKVDSFKIDCSKIIEMSPVNLDEWIRFAVMKGVEELHVRLNYWSSYALEFPESSLVSSTLNLEHLSFQNGLLRHPTTEIKAFNQLTTLCLKSVQVDESLIESLFSVFLLLESLTLDRCQTVDRTLKPPVSCSGSRLVAGDRLTHLNVTDSKESTIMHISAPNLAFLEYHPYVCWSFSLKAPRLSRIVYSLDKRHLLVKLPDALIQFASCPELETLHLQSPVEMPPTSSIPIYGNLKQLHLDIDLDRRSTHHLFVCSVLNLLKAAPLLEELTIKTQNGLDLSGTNPKETIDHYGFTNDHLKLVKMQAFKGNWYEIRLAICILENSPKLEKMVIDHFRSWDGEKFSERRQSLGVVEGKLKGVKTDAQIIFL